MIKDLHRTAMNGKLPRHKRTKSRENSEPIKAMDFTTIEDEVQKNKYINKQESIKDLEFKLVSIVIILVSIVVILEMSLVILICRKMCQNGTKCFTNTITLLNLLNSKCSEKCLVLFMCDLLVLYSYQLCAVKTARVSVIDAVFTKPTI